MKVFQRFDILLHALIAVAVFMFMTGCSAKQANMETSQPVKRPASQYVKPDVNYLAKEVYDPWEGYNRTMYSFNAKFDKYIFLPVVNGYKFIMPDFAEQGVSNFFNNIGEVFTLANSILQLKGEKSANTTARFVVNSTIGILGLFDVATQAGIEREKEDFGQTLGHYGVGPGPYFVIPIAGPSNLRDTTGLAVESAAFYLVDPFNFDDNPEWGLAYNVLKAVDKRNQLYNFRYYENGSPFEYEMIRVLYNKARQFQIDN